MKRTTARALTVATTLAVAGAVAGAGTLSSAITATPAVAAPNYSVVPATYSDSAALAASTAARATFAERASRDAAARTARIKALKAAKAAKAKAIAKKRAALRKKAARAQQRSTYALASGSPRAIGRHMAASRGWTGPQWDALDRLWTAESGWTVTAGNGSGAYGIPQALPGSKMASAGGNWRTSARTQISWGLGYIAGRWGTPSNAWAHFQSSHWY